MTFDTVGADPPGRALQILRAKLMTRTPPPVVRSVDELDDGDTARVEYVDPDVAVGALENVLGGYCMAVLARGPSFDHLRAVAVDEAGELVYQWRADAEWARWIEDDEYRRILEAVAETSDRLALPD